MTSFGNLDVSSFWHSPFLHSNVPVVNCGQSNVSAHASGRESFALEYQPPLEDVQPASISMKRPNPHPYSGVPSLHGGNGGVPSVISALQFRSHTHAKRAPDVSNTSDVEDPLLDEHAASARHTP
jgi:hypothetical protein